MQCSAGSIVIHCQCLSHQIPFRMPLNPSPLLVSHTLHFRLEKLASNAQPCKTDTIQPGSTTCKKVTRLHTPLNHHQHQPPRAPAGMPQERKNRNEPLADGEQQSAIDAMDVKQIESTQRALSSAYKQLARGFSKSRLNRMDSFIDKIDSIQQQLRRQVVGFDAELERVMPQLDEEYGVESSHGLPKQLQRNVTDGNRSPPPEVLGWPELRPLPIFEPSFERVLQPYRESLSAIKNRYELRSELAEADARRNSRLVWRQHLKQRVDLRRARRLQAEEQLHRLDEDYLNTAKEIKLHNAERRYRASIRRVGERKAKSDLAQISEQLRKNGVLKVDAQLVPSTSPLASLTPEEADVDLQMIRSQDAKVERIEANYLYMEQPLKKALVNGPTTMTDLVNSEIESKTIGGYQHQQLQLQQQQQQPQQPFGGPPPQPFGSMPPNGMMFPPQMYAGHPPPPPPPQPQQTQQQQQQQQPYGYQMMP